MIAFALALLLAAQAPAADAASDEQAIVAAVAARGRLIYAYDRAAWLGTDDARAKIPDAANRIAGYVTDGPADAPRLIFFSKAPVPEAVYVAQLRGGKLVEGKLLGANDDRTLSPTLLRSIQALATAHAALIAARVSPCAAAPFNTVVLPPEVPSAPVRVYFLTPQTDNGHLPFGGHYEVDVTPAGSAGTVRAFTKSCMAMPKVAPKGQMQMAVVTHLLDPVPTEMHVFDSLALGKPLMIGTLHPTPRLWIVDGGRISGPRPFPPAR